MDEFDLRQMISAEIAKVIGGDQSSRWARIPYVNKAARELARRFDLNGWPGPDEISRQVKQAVAEYA